jgi:hypothetical protein
VTRYSRSEMAILRSDVKSTFNKPSDTQMRPLMATFERIHGRLPSTGQHRYLVRLFRIHGPETGGLMEQIYREHGTTENLLLAIEIYPRTLPSGVPNAAPDEPPLTVV